MKKCITIILVAFALSITQAQTQKPAGYTYNQQVKSFEV